MLRKEGRYSDMIVGHTLCFSIDVIYLFMLYVCIYIFVCIYGHWNIYRHIYI
jgi:hypothetical protein